MRTWVILFVFTKPPNRKEKHMDKGNLVIVNKIFQLNMPTRRPIPNKLASLLKEGIEKALLLHKLNETYHHVAEYTDPKEFVDKTLESLNISYDIKDDELASIPRVGPLVIISNHPFGGIEGLIFSSILLGIRHDTKIMANYLLGRIPQLKDILFCVDPFEKDSAARRNLKPLRDSISWLRADHALVLFPAGEVSSINLQQRQVIDPAWYTTTARIVRKSGASVLPVFFEGTNSALFQAAGLIHPGLRTAMLPHELLNKQHKTIKIRTGGIVPFQKMERLIGDDELTKYLRMRTYALKHRETIKLTNKGATMVLHKGSDVPFRLLESEPGQGLLEEEVKKLPRDQILIDTGDYTVFHARAHQIPNLLFEIGRLREITFRKNGEGTGKPIDLDRFDLYYTHLFIWNSKQREVVGAYRLGLVDMILDRFGQKGLYSSTLFNYKDTFLQRVACGIELGRSFVRSEYQKLYLPLLLLWKGIARFAVQNPSYTTLFGLVSVSDAYSPLSKQLIVSFLTINHYAPELAQFVKPKISVGKVLKRRHRLQCASSLPSDIEELSSLIADIESDRKGIPILLKHYVKLGGKLMSFGLDPSFGNVLDGLVLVDLLKSDRRIMNRFMGEEGASRYFGYHQDPPLLGIAS
jgi:putative hemolysin